jgi:hypothetical protein
LGAFNRAGKTVTKIGIYSKPPLKSEFYSHFIKNWWFNLSRPNLKHFLVKLYCLELCFRRSEFEIFTMNGDLVFLDLAFVSVGWEVLGLFSFPSETTKSVSGATFKKRTNTRP